jgi:hypothetical protein
MQRQVGTTSQIIQVFILNSTSTTGAGLTGVTYNAAGLTCYYKRNTASADVAVTLATMTLGTWATGGWKEVDSTNMPGLYEIGIPNAALASGADLVTVYIQGAASMVPLPIQIELTGTSNQDGTRGGMTALPNANAASNGGLPTCGTSNYQIDLDASGRVDVGKWLGTLVTAASAGIPDVNVKNFDNAAAGALPTNFSSLAIDSSGRVTYAPGEMQVKTNTALNNFAFLMVSSSDHVTPKTGLTVTAQRAINGGAFAACTNAPTELANGIYLINLSAADLNGSVITFLFSATAADSRYVTIVTQA